MVQVDCDPLLIYNYSRLNARSEGVLKLGLGVVLQSSWASTIIYVNRPSASCGRSAPQPDTYRVVIPYEE